MDGAADSKPSRLSRNQRLILAGLWLFALAMIAAQYLGVQHLEALNGNRDLWQAGLLSPSARWIFFGDMLPLAAVTAALVLQFRWMSIGWRILAGLALALLVPIDALAAFVMLLLEDTSVTSQSGRRFVVTPDDHSFTFLEEQFGPLGLYLRMIDRPLMTPHARLAVSRDDKWLVIRDEDGLTHCYVLLPDGLGECPGISNWRGPDSEADMRDRTARISKLTGLRP